MSPGSDSASIGAPCDRRHQNRICKAGGKSEIVRHHNRKRALRRKPQGFHQHRSDDAGQSEPSAASASLAGSFHKHASNATRLLPAGQLRDATPTEFDDIGQLHGAPLVSFGANRAGSVARC